MPKFPKIEQSVYIISRGIWGNVRSLYNGAAAAGGANVFIPSTGKVESFSLYGLSSIESKYSTFTEAKCNWCSLLRLFDGGVEYADGTFTCSFCKYMVPMKCGECKGDFDYKTGKLFGNKRDAACEKCLTKFNEWRKLRVATSLIQDAIVIPQPSEPVRVEEALGGLVRCQCDHFKESHRITIGCIRCKCSKFKEFESCAKCSHDKDEHREIATTSWCTLCKDYEGSKWKHAFIP